MRSTLAIAAAGAVLFWASAGLADRPELSNEAFVNKASIANLFEIDEAKLALDRATEPRLKAFAQRMIADHRKAEQALVLKAQRIHLKPAQALDAPRQAMLDNLKTFHGADFDKIYAADQQQAHAYAVALLSDYKQNGRNEFLRSWAIDTLPVVKSHKAAIDAM